MFFLQINEINNLFLISSKNMQMNCLYNHFDFDVKHDINN